MDNFDLDNFGLEDGDLASGDTSTETPQENTQQTEAPAQTFKYTASGKEVEEDLNTILKRASQGYHYAQNMQQFNQQKQAFESERQRKEAEIRELEGKWSQYDQYAKENPEWAEYVRTQWEQRQLGLNGQQSTQTDSNVSPQLANEIAELRRFRDEFKGFMADQKREREDLELNGQIDQTRKEYSDIDFSHSDPETGKSLEFKVLEHMQAHGLNNFRAAFRDFYHDQLLARAVTKAKEDTATTLQERQQKGFIAESDTPFTGLKQATSIKNKSYFDLIDEGIQEFGLNQ